MSGHGDVLDVEVKALVLVPEEGGLGEGVDCGEVELDDLNRSPPAGDLLVEVDGLKVSSSKDSVAKNWNSESKNVVHRVSAERSLDVSWLL
jgi:hypothetical protein